MSKNIKNTFGPVSYTHLIPPMVLVDKALMAVKNGDFSDPTERKIKPVPEGEGDESAANRQQPIVDTPPSANTCLLYTSISHHTYS